MEDQFGVGEIVLYTYQESDAGAEHAGKVRPAIVVEVHPRQYQHETGRAETGYDLRILTGSEGTSNNCDLYLVLGCRRVPRDRQLPGTCRRRDLS